MTLLPISQTCKGLKTTYKKLWHCIFFIIILKNKKISVTQGSACSSQLNMTCGHPNYYDVLIKMKFIKLHHRFIIWINPCFDWLHFSSTQQPIRFKLCLFVACIIVVWIVHFILEWSFHKKHWFWNESIWLVANKQPIRDKSCYVRIFSKCPNEIYLIKSSKNPNWVTLFNNQSESWILCSKHPL